MSHSTVPRRLLSLLALACVATTARAQDPFVARTGELPLDSNYVAVNLDRLANDTATTPATTDSVTVRNVPFKLVRQGGQGSFFMKPIEWSAARNEDAEYPGYIAKYDSVPDPADKTQAVVSIPVGDYSAIWLLAATDNDPALADSLTFRIGVKEGQARATYHDFTATVPRANAADGPNATKVATTPAGNLFLVRVPLGKSIAQDFTDRRSLELEITKSLKIAINQPDPYRFQLRPLGPPSGVRIYGLTLEKAGITMNVTGTEPGYVFNQPQTPTFKLAFQNLNNLLGKFQLEVVARRDDGFETKIAYPDLHYVYARVYANPAHNRTITVPVKDAGYYDLTITLRQGATVLAQREGSFALLPPDTRKYRNESPFGTWDFGGVHFTANDSEVTGPLYVKAGLRYGMAALASETTRRQYGLLDGGDPRVRNAEEVKYYVDRMKADPEVAAPTRFLIFHESAISGPHLTRTPDLFTGKTYKLDEGEQKQFAAMKKEAQEAYKAIRASFPKAEIYFGNTVPHVLEEFLRDKYPRSQLDKIGNESGNFMRLPENQPLDFVSNNAGMWMMREIADHYGYNDMELRQCLEITYPGSGPGNLKESTQAAYYSRHMLHSLAWRIPVIRPGSMTDMGNSYYFSNWGAIGFCRAAPDVRPKPAYVAVANTTLATDGAKFSRSIATPSSVVYATEFVRKDKTYVTALWTVRGSRALQIAVPTDKANRAMSLMGRDVPLTATATGVALDITTQPLFLFSRKPITGIALGATHNEGRPTGRTAVLSPLANLANWTVQAGADTELEVYNFMNPRRKGDFTYRPVAELAGEKNVLEVAPKLPVAGPVYLQMYSGLTANQPLEIPGEPTEIGVMVHGNGGWGRLIFELEDAGGQRWISIGAEQAGPPNPWMADWFKPEEFAKLKSSNLSDWNSDDAWGRSFINFDGWRYLKFPMPGQYPGEGYHWPGNSQWRASGNGVVKYPLKFKRLVVTMPEKVLHLADYAPPARREIYLKDLSVSYRPIEEVFSGE